jgi:hypothetical protein
MGGFGTYWLVAALPNIRSSVREMIALASELVLPGTHLLP